MPPKIPSPKTDEKPDSPGLGWPGYRTREGRTGWDPVDADNEAAHVTGTLLQRLFFARTRNPLHLALLGLLGLALVLPPLLAIVDILQGNLSSLRGWFFLLLCAIAGTAVLVNVIRNLRRKDSS